MASIVAEIDNTAEVPGQRAPLVTGGLDLGALTDTVSSVWERPRPPRAWYIAFGISTTLVVALVAMIGYLVLNGVGVWGVNRPVGWGFAIVNFVFWIGIGHAGTLISAVLFLFRQKWRTGINRFAEAMTIFAVLCAGLFPGIHMGRVWFAYWMPPIPNQMALWPNFRSPLMWDVFAVGTYFTVSLLFWYVGMIPDLATFRDRATTKGRQIIYGLLALGWTGSSRHWHRFERAYLLLAALATPLVLSVHSVVSFDFAVSQLPGWHATIFPPYFVAGAIFGGLAMVVTLAVPARELFGLKHIITLRHLENLCKLTLATGCLVAYAYGLEFFTAWYSGNPHESFIFRTRALGPYAWACWTMIGCNVVAPQLFWFKWFRSRPWAMFAVVMCVNAGMWFERFVIVISSLAQDFLPASWGYYSPTWVDLLTLAGSFGLFFTLFLLFCRYLPMVAMAETKGVMPHAGIAPVASDLRVRREAVAAAGDVEAGAKRGGPALLEFDSADALLAAAARVRDAGYTRWDTYSPYAVHGIERAMGIRRTRLPWVVLLLGVIGCTTGLLLQWWTNAAHPTDFPRVPVNFQGYAYPISGKPVFSLPADIPVIFELTVLLAALAAAIGMLAMNNLPRHHHALLAQPRFRRATRDRFFLSIDGTDPRFDAVQTPKFLATLGGAAVVPADPTPTSWRLPRNLVIAGLIVVCLALLPPLFVAKARVARSQQPRIHLVADMDNQPRYKAQQAHPLFADGRELRPQVAGTMARGDLSEDPHFYEGKVGGEPAATFPPQVLITEQLLRRGQERFNIYCAPCHGLGGAGDGIVSQRAIKLETPGWVPPAALATDPLVVGRSHGQLFNTITAGIRTMPPYGDQIPVADRWAIIAYVRALQRSQNARLEDVPEELRQELR